MRVDLVALGLNPGDLRLQLRNARGKLALRIAVEAFAGQKARGITAAHRTFFVFHCNATLDALRFVSTPCIEQPRPRVGIATGITMASELPASMNAIGFDEPGGPEVLRPKLIPVPRPGPGEVLVKVAYAGVNRPDIIQRRGLYPPPPGASPIPGLEISGSVAARGAGVLSLLPGARVCALVAGGGYAEYCLARAEHCLPVPESLPLDQAAALPETLFTVWHNVFQRGFARDGETILVHGGTSGIGSMAAMLGKIFGLTVIATCGGADKCEAALRIGAAHAIDYKATDFVAEVERITGGKGVDIVLDMVAGDYVARNLKCLAEEGRHVTIAVQGGARAEINMAMVMTRRLTLTGSTLRPRSNEFKALLADEIGQEVWPLVAAGELRPVMDRVFPLADAAAAHARMEAGAHIGKIVLAV